MKGRPDVAVVDPGAASRGSVAVVALRHARLLAEEFDVVLVSDGVASDPASFEPVCVGERSFARLGRIGHALELFESWGGRFTLDIVGDGSLGPGLRRAAEGLGDRVRFLGWLEKRDLGRIFGGAHLLCVPSCSEPFRSVAPESLLAGTPVLAKRGGGLPFVIRDGENGLLVPAGQPNAIAEALGRIWAGAVPLSSLQESSRRSVWPRFSWGRVGDSLRKLVCSVIARRSDHRELSWERV